MDDLMNKVGALIEEHVKGEVESHCCQTQLNLLRKQRDEAWAENAHLVDRYSKDEIRRGARALGFWEKLCEYLWDGITDDATFEEVMRKVQSMEETTRVCRDRVETERGIAAQALQERTAARVERDDAKEQLKELLSTLGLAHFDRSTIEGAIKETRKRDARLVSERDMAKAQLEAACAKVRELDAKLLGVRKAVGESAQPKVDDKVRCGHWHGVVIGFRVEDGAVMVRRTYNGGSELRYLKAEELDIVAP